MPDLHPDPASPALDPGLVERFRADGVVVVPDVFDPDELARFAAAVDAAVADDRRDDDRTLAQRSRYEQSFQQCLDLWTRYPDVVEWSCHPGPAAIAAQLLGVDAVRLWHDQALYKEAGGRETDPHQDHPYWPITETDQVTGWIPFDGSTAEAGAMAYWPGSHRLGLDRFVNIFGDETPEDIGSDPALEDIDPVTVEVPPGAVAFHHALTAHRAGANHTGATRRVHTMIYLADGCHRSEKGRHPSVDFDEIVPGAPIDGSLTPVVWPRPLSDLPSVPPGAAEMFLEINRIRRDRHKL